MKFTASVIAVSIATASAFAPNALLTRVRHALSIDIASFDLFHLKALCTNLLSYSQTQHSRDTSLLDTSLVSRQQRDPVAFLDSLDLDTLVELHLPHHQPLLLHLLFLDQSLTSLVSVMLLDRWEATLP